MNNKSFKDNMSIIKKNIDKFLGLMAFIATGGGLIISTAIHEKNIYKTEILVIIGCFYIISLIDYFKKLILEEDNENI